MDNFLPVSTIEAVYKNLDLKEFLSTTIDSTYEGVAMIRPTFEQSNDGFVKDLLAGGTMLQFSRIGDDGVPVFKVISSTSNYGHGYLELPFAFLQKASLEDFRPWAKDTVVKHNEFDGWEVVLDYTGTGAVITQVLQTSAIKLRKFEDLTHGRMYNRYGNVAYPKKGSHGAILNKEQAQVTGFPEGSVLPFLSFHGNIDGFATCKLHGTNIEFKYGELNLTRSNFFRQLNNTGFFDSNN